MSISRSDAEAAYRAARAVAGSRPSRDERAVLSRIRAEYGIARDEAVEPAVPEGDAARALAFRLCVRVASADGLLTADERDAMLRLGRAMEVAEDAIGHALSIVAAPPVEGMRTAVAPAASLLAELAERRRRTRLQRRNVSAALAAAHFVPFIGIAFAAWNPVDLIYLYGLELVAMALLTWARMMPSALGGAGSPAERIFAVVSYPFVQGVMLAAFFIGIENLRARIAEAWGVPDPAPFGAAHLARASFIAALLALLAADAYAFTLLRLGRGEYLRGQPGRVALLGLGRTTSVVAILLVAVPAATLASWGIQWLAARPGVTVDPEGATVIVGTVALGVVAILRLIAEVQLWTWERDASWTAWRSNRAAVSGR